MQYSKKRFYFSLCLFLLSLILISGLMSINIKAPSLEIKNTTETSKNEDVPPPKGTYIIVDPFVIDGNADFTDLSANYSWCTGNGSATNGFIISNIIIDAEDAGNCLKIRNVNKNFTIKNCIFMNSGEGKSGILLDKVTNGSLLNNTIQLNSIGIHIKNCTRLDIIGNYFIRNKIGMKVEHGKKPNGDLKLTTKNNIWHNLFIYSKIVQLQDLTGNNYIHNGTFGNYWSDFKSPFNKLVNFTIKIYGLTKLTVYQSQRNYTIPESFSTLDKYPIIANDSDKDGLDDLLERLYWLTLPNNNDKDGDGMADGWEAANDLDPLDSSDAKKDADDDDLENLTEFKEKYVHKDDDSVHKTDPNDADSDNDGFTDGKEVDEGTDPTDFFDHPDREAEEAISFGFAYLVFIIVGITSLIVFYRRKLIKN